MFSVQIYYTFSKLGAATAKWKGKIKNESLGNTWGKVEHGFGFETLIFTSYASLNKLFEVTFSFVRWALKKLYYRLRID